MIGLRFQVFVYHLVLTYVELGDGLLMFTTVLGLPYESTCSSRHAQIGALENLNQKLPMFPIFLWGFLKIFPETHGNFRILKWRYITIA